MACGDPIPVLRHVMVLVGRSADARAERRYHLAIPMVVGALGLVLASWMPNLPLLILMLTIATAGLTTALPMFCHCRQQFSAGAPWLVVWLCSILLAPWQALWPLYWLYPDELCGALATSVVDGRHRIDRCTDGG
jgi:hypothetical protein